MAKIIYLGLFLVLLQVVLSQYATDFSADFRSTKPTVSGFLTGKLYYSETQKSIRYDFNPAGEYFEIYHYDTSNTNDLFVYKACTKKCDIIPQPKDVKQPKFNFVSTDTCSPTANTNAFYGTCHLCTSSSGTVKSYCLKDLTSDIPIQVTLNDNTVIDMTNHVAAGTAALAATYSPPSTWGCVLNCGSVADIVLVIDESGSISDSEWSLLRQFAVNLVNGFEISPDKINMGLVFFSTGARYALNVISDQNAYRKAISDFVRLNYGTTWIGAGTVYAGNLLKQSQRQVPKIAILLTDGYPNDKNPFPLDGKYWRNTPYNDLEWLVWFRSFGYKLVTIGVGTDSEINPTYLTNIADSPSYFFRASSFSTLNNAQLIKDITQTVCTASGTPTQCPSCMGLCTCGTCGCPSTCDDQNPCTVDSCSPTKNNQGGCVYEKTNCDDKNACTADGCDPKSGCTHTNINCNDNDVCTTDTCNPSVGCVRTPISCDDGNACTRDSCDPKNGCQHTIISCDDGIPCTIDTCDPKSGCQNKLKDQNFCFDPTEPCSVKDCEPATGNCVEKKNLCIDDNPCTYNAGPSTFLPIDCTRGSKCISSVCDINSTNTYNGCTNETINCDDGSMCTIDTCDNSTGCKYAAVNCDDNNMCTIDSCNKTSGCVHVDLVCDDKNECTTDTCDTKVGCIFTPIVCNDDNACTDDTCNSTTKGGCVFTLKDIPTFCNDGSVCTIDTCDPKKGCEHTTINCTVNSTATPVTTNATAIPCVTIPRCDSVRGCLFEQKCDSKIDKKVVCNIEKCDGNEKNCKTDKNPVDACAAIIAASLSAGIIAAIVIGAVVFAGGAVGGAVALNQFVFKGEFTNSSQIYQAETQTVQNPAFNRTSVFNQKPTNPT